MPLNKPLLINEIVNVLKKIEKEERSKEKARLELAKGLANAIEKYVRSGTVTTTVVTAGSAVAQTGTGTGVIT